MKTRKNATTKRLIIAYEPKRVKYRVEIHVMYTYIQSALSLYF